MGTQIFPKSRNEIIIQGDTKPVPSWELTNIGRHHTKFIPPGDLAAGIFAPLL
jgi:hypothetical protein